MTETAMNGAESLIRTLKGAGIDLVIGNPGTSEMHLVTALDRVDGVRGVLGLFEGVVTGAADGYARMAGKPAATLLHLGPGLGNGLANLHNARKAQSPVVNLIGEHATWHRQYDAPLSSDVEAFSATVSHVTLTSRSARDVAADGTRIVRAALEPPGQIASLILPADVTWNASAGPADPLPVPSTPHVPDRAVDDTVRALRAGNAALLLRGAACSERGLALAGRIADACGARLMADTFLPRIARGAGRVSVERMPYRAQAATAFMAGVRTLILVGTQAPVGFFAYPGQPSEFTPPGVAILQLSHPHEDGLAALEAVAAAFPAASPRIMPLDPSPLPADGMLTPEAVMRVVAHHLPEHAVVTEEGITATFGLYGILETARPFDCLQLTGGAIGAGLPLATGAALATPGRKGVVLQADGSALYTLQSLWTMARERLDVTVIIYANRAYRILFEELKGVGADLPGPKTSAMFDLGDPAIDWVKLAEGMGVEAVRAETTARFEAAFRSAVGATGPRLIEAVI